MATVCTEHMSKHRRFVAALRCFSYCSGNHLNELRIDEHLACIRMLESWIDALKDTARPISDGEYDLHRQMQDFECAEWLSDYNDMLDAEVQFGYDFVWDDIDTRHYVWGCKTNRPRYRHETCLDLEGFVEYRKLQIDKCRAEIAYAKDSSIEGFRIMTETFEKD